MSDLGNCKRCGKKLYDGHIHTCTPERTDEMRTELVGYDEIGSAERTVVDSMTHCSHGVSYDVPCDKCSKFRDDEMAAWHKKKLERILKEPVYSIEQAVELIMEHPNLKIWSTSKFWSATTKEVIELIQGKKV